MFLYVTLYVVANHISQMQLPTLDYSLLCGSLAETQLIPLAIDR